MSATYRNVTNSAFPHIVMRGLTAIFTVNVVCFEIYVYHSGVSEYLDRLVHDAASLSSASWTSSPWRWRHSLTSKRREPFTQRNSIIPQQSRIPMIIPLNNNARTLITVISPSDTLFGLYLTVVLCHFPSARLWNVAVKWTTCLYHVTRVREPKQKHHPQLSKRWRAKR